MGRFCVERVLGSLDVIRGRFSEDMVDGMGGGWLLGDRFSIEEDLGMCVEVFDELMRFREGVLLLRERGVEFFEVCSVREFYLVVRFGLDG